MLKGCIYFLFNSPNDFVEMTCGNLTTLLGCFHQPKRLITKPKGEKVATKALEQDTTTKASKVVLEQVKELVEIRAEITRLEKQKEALTAEIEKSFGVDKQNKTSKATTLKHNNIEFARLDWRTRRGVDTEKLALEYPEAYEACQKPTIYSVIVSLFK